MDPTSWSAYSQHFSRLGASMNHPPGALSQQAQMNDLALSSSLPRQEHIPGYGNAGGPHHFLLAASHGLNPSQANHNDPSFNANLFAANYDASLFSSSFPSANKGHLASFPQGAAGLFKAVNRENDFNDLRTGFSHCGMSAYARNSDGNNGLSSGSGLASGHLFPNSMPPGSWRHSGMIPSSCGPFGVLPHETVLQRSHLVGRGGDKLSVQASKQSRASLPSSSFVEQDLSRGYRSILSSPARPPSSYVDSSNTSHSSLLSPQSDPYFSSVSDNYYSSCSKNDFAAYSSYCSNVQPGVQRSSISPYCYPQTFGNFEPNEKQDVPTTSTNTSANANFTNFVPNSSLNGNPTHLHNGQISRQSVITSNINNNSAMYNSESHPQNHSYNVREAYPYPPGAAHANSCLPTHPTNSRSEVNGGRQSLAHMNNSHHSSSGQNLYPPMSTPIPASTPAHTTPPSSSMGQAYVPTPLPMSHDSGCSSVNSQSVMYHSPSNDGCYSTPGTCHSESGSPAKQDLSQHSSPSVYSIESSNLSMASGPFVEQHHVRSHSGSEVNYNVMNGGLASDVQDNTNDSNKAVEENLREVGSALVASDCRSQQKDVHLPQVLPIDMVKINKESAYQNVVDARFENRPANIPIQALPLNKHLDPLISKRSECALNTKSDVFAFSSDSPPPALDFTSKGKIKCKRGRKRKSEATISASPLNCTYSHLQNSESRLTSPESVADPEDIKTPLSTTSVNDHSSPAVGNDLSVANTSPLPVDLSHSVNLTVKKPESPPEKKDVKETLPDLNYETDKSSGGKWSLTKPDVPEDEPKIPISEDPENLTIQNTLEKDPAKCDSPLCRTPPMDDLSDESKKLCNSIEEDLGFLAGLSSDPDVEDSASKGSFSDKKGKKEKGFLQSFLTFLESSNEPPVSANAVSVEDKAEKKEIARSSPKKEEEKKVEATPNADHKNNGDKNLIEENDDKDNFDEAPSLDPTLFACSTLQKEMVVPNPEAPSFSSDEDENSTQGIFDSVAMAIQRLCEDNEEDHSEKGNKSSSSSKSSSSKKEMPILTNMADDTAYDVEMPESSEPHKEDSVEECTIKRACVLKGRKGKRRRTRHLLVIKVKRTADKTPVLPNNLQAPSSKPKRTRSAAKDVQIIKTMPNSQRRTLMRKCKEKSLRKKNSRATKRKARNCVKKKYGLEEKGETVDIVIDDDDDETKNSKEQEVEKEKPTEPPVLPIVITPPLPDVVSSQSTVTIPQPTTAPPPQPIPTSPQPIPTSPQLAITLQQPLFTLQTTPITPQPTSAPLQPFTTVQIRPTPPKKKKVNKTIGYRTRKRRRKPRKPPLPLLSTAPVSATVVVVVEPEPLKVNEEAAVNVSSIENPDIQTKPSASSSESSWNTETHFKTGDYVISIDSKDSECPSIWRIEGKNVLQLFEVLENKGSNSILYRNTSSYLRWSPSSKHKYLKQLVKIIKSDDDTVIVELLRNSENVAEKDVSSSCDYSVHPQRENFEVYLQTLVSHALDPDFIPEIVKEKDEYFLSHLQAIEEITSQKKSALHQSERWSTQLSSAVKIYPHVNLIKSTDEGESMCQVCQNSKIQFVAHFHGHVYDPMTLASKDEGKGPSTCDFNFPLCGACVQTVTLYNRLHHHKYHFFQLGCKKVKDVKKGEDKDSHTILEECLQDAEWMTQMFQDMLEMWNACDKYR